MKMKTKEIDLTALSPEPTIWALRKNPRAANEAAIGDHSLYEHLFGYDPIRMITGVRSNQVEDSVPTSAENPNLNILNAGTNFAVMEMASELEEETV
jgi:hypothetical protein